MPVLVHEFGYVAQQTGLQHISEQEYCGGVEGVAYQQLPQRHTQHQFEKVNPV